MCDISESTMKNRMNQGNGWDIILYKEEQYRSIRIGSQLNCNNEIYKNILIRNYFESIMSKYNIKKYEIEEIDTPIEFSYQLNLTEDMYNIFRDTILNETIHEKETEKER